MPKVTIVTPKRNAAKDHSNMSSTHKPMGKTKPGKVNVKKSK
jgi:hypothetical protein